jgi:hypothetical protein
MNQKLFFTAKTHTCRGAAVPGKDAKFSDILRVLCAFAVRLQMTLAINPQEGDHLLSRMAQICECHE